jgi:hypothetical protein
MPALAGRRASVLDDRCAEPLPPEFHDVTSERHSGALGDDIPARGRRPGTSSVVSLAWRFQPSGGPSMPAVAIGQYAVVALFRRKRKHEPADPDERSPESGVRYKDLAVVGELLEHGADLTEPRHALYFLYFAEVNRPPRRPLARQHNGAFKSKSANRSRKTPGSGRSSARCTTSFSTFRRSGNTATCSTRSQRAVEASTTVGKHPSDHRRWRDRPRRLAGHGCHIDWIPRRCPLRDGVTERSSAERSVPVRSPMNRSCGSSSTTDVLVAMTAPLRGEPGRASRSVPDSLM